MNASSGKLQCEVSIDQPEASHRQEAADVSEGKSRRCERSVSRTNGSYEGS